MVHGLNTYVIGNRTNPKGIIVLYSDVFGLDLPNNKLIADSYTKSGEWLVYMPDFFKGNPMSLKFADVAIPVDASKQSSLSKYSGLLATAPSLIGFMAKHREGPTNKTCMDFLEALRRATPRDQKIGMVGFCWGGKYALRAAQEKNMIKIGEEKIPLVDAVVALHPSNLALPADAENLIVPTSCGWGTEDTMTKIELKGQIEEITAAAQKAGKVVPEMEHKVYKGGRHGFAVRGNPEDPLERACLEDSVTQVLNWFSRWL
jgi:dienelactone hydrolase